MKLPVGCPCTTPSFPAVCPEWSSGAGTCHCSRSPRCPGSHRCGSAGPRKASRRRDIPWPARASRGEERGQAEWARNLKDRVKREEGRGGNKEFQLSLWRVLLACLALFSLQIYCISGLSATWSTLCCLAASGSRDTKHNPAFYISLTHCLSLPLLLSVSLLLYSCNTHTHTLLSRSILSPPPTLPCSLSSSLTLFHAISFQLEALSSDLASLWPAPSIPSLPPSPSPSLQSGAPTWAWSKNITELSHVWHKETTQTPTGAELERVCII